MASGQTARYRAAAVLAIVVAAVVAARCGASTPASPTTGTPTAPGGPTYTIAGGITNASDSRPIGGATVAVTTGGNVNRSVSTDPNGMYALGGLVGGALTLHASASGFMASDKTASLPADTHVDFALQPMVSTPQCNPTLWQHVHDVKRLKVISPCQGVTGVIAATFTNYDGDIDMQLTVDPPYAYLLNSGNMSKLHGNLQTEAICQAPINPDVPDALRSCSGFKGTVPIPPIGTHVQMAGPYVLDQDHGWMEIHPISILITN